MEIILIVILTLIVIYLLHKVKQLQQAIAEESAARLHDSVTLDKRIDNVIKYIDTGR